MPRTFKEFLPEKDYAGRLALGLGFLILGQVMAMQEGVIFSMLRWIFFIAAIVNYGLVLYLYQRQKQEKMDARQSAPEKPGVPDDKK